jgi:hypothetical protein
MTLVRRRPREVYRVYSEEEYLNGAGAELAGVGEWPAGVEPARHGSGERRLRRVAGVAMLTGAVGAVGGVVALNGPWARHGAERGTEGLVAATHTKAVRRPASMALDSQAAPARPVIERASASSRARVSQAGRSFRHRGRRSTAHSSNHQLLRVPTHPHGGVAVVVDYVPRPSSSGPPEEGAPEEGGTTTTTTTGERPDASAPAPDVTTSPEAESGSGSGAESESGSGNQAEFGFER